MQVSELEARHVRVPLRRPVKHASHTRTETDNVVVRCVLSDGSVGWGEGVPREYVTGETVDSALELLRGSDLPAQLELCPDFEQAVRLADRLKLAPVPADDRMCRGNAARCAVELAVLDAYGRAFGEPLMNVTKLLAPDLYEPKEKVQYSGVVLSATGLKAKALSFAYRVMGFAHVKVKVGLDGQDDTARLATVRRWAGRSMNLRVDANEAWGVDEVAERIRALEPFGITSAEQPVRHEDVQALATIRKQINTPVMLDESLCSEVDAERAVANGWCDLFNIRLSKCGGFIPSLRLAGLAARHGLGYQLGCQVGETAILSAAGRHFATSVKDLRYLEGSFDRRLVLDWLTEEDITFGTGGWAPMLTGCGLGVRIEPERVDAMTVRREVLLG
jgi:L-alanine-DL-glutamate epimerase-like enolase superfamily enzyme